MRKAINLKDAITSTWQYSHAGREISEATRIREYVRVRLDHRVDELPFHAATPG